MELFTMFIAVFITAILWFALYCVVIELLEDRANKGFSKELTEQIEKTRLMGEDLKKTNKRIRMNDQELREHCYMGTQFIDENEFKV